MLEEDFLIKRRIYLDVHLNKSNLLHTLKKGGMSGCLEGVYGYP